MPTLEHRPVPGEDFETSGSCGGCETCRPAPAVCLACSYDAHGHPDTPVTWPCSQAATQETTR